MKRLKRLETLGAIDGESAYAGQFEEGTGVYRITVIRPGQGSSGVYTKENLAASVGRFTAGTHMYMDHEGPQDRPERSVRDLAGVFLEDATVAEDGSLSAVVRVYPSFNKIIREKFDAIGVSINAFTYAGNDSESNVVPPFDGVVSVDFVTRAGAGGAITEVLESDDPTATPEEGRMEEKIDKLIEAVSALTNHVTEAMKPKDEEKKPEDEKKPFPPEDEEKKDKPKREAGILDAFKVAKADLPDEAAERVLKALESSEGSVDDLIAAEKKYIESVQAPVAGAVEHSESTKPSTGAFVVGR